MSADGPGCVKKAPYLSHPQNDADIRVTELKFSLEAILRAPLQLPAAPI
jgi:hypothetical protein